GKNSFRGPNNWNMDMGLHKTFYPLANHENFGVQFRAEFFNVFNHTQLNVNVATNTNTVAVSSASFGAIRNAYDPRIIQLALKVLFKTRGSNRVGNAPVYRAGGWGRGTVQLFAPRRTW